MRPLVACVLFTAFAVGPASAYNDVEMVPAYVKECPTLALNTRRYEEVLTATLALASNAVKGKGEARSRSLPGIYVEPSQRGAFCRDVLADYGPKGRKMKGLVRKK
jgi:hypothetical protein